MKINETSKVKGTVYESFENLDEACDELKIQVFTVNKRIRILVNGNRPFSIYYTEFNKDEIINDSVKFRKYIQRNIETKIKTALFKHVYIGTIINPNHKIKNVTFPDNVVIKDKINNQTFTYYATSKQQLDLLSLNKKYLISEKVQILRIPEKDASFVTGYDYSSEEPIGPTGPTGPIGISETVPVGIIGPTGVSGPFGISKSGPFGISRSGPTGATPFEIIGLTNDFIARIGGNTSLSRTNGTLSYNGTYVFVFDTGIEKHPLLNINAELSRDFTVREKLEDKTINPLFINGWSTDSADPFRNIPNGHGTHVAGTIGARDARFAVAPGVQIVAYKVIPGNTAVMERALTELERFRINNRNVNIIANMSMGFPVRARPANDLLVYERTINRLASERNITFIAAAGNSTQDSSAFSPARLDSVITVGSYENRRNQISRFSNFGGSVDILAPGEDIFSTWLAAGFRSIQGTSMAAPVVAGACVNMLAVEAKRNLNSILTPQQIKNRLREDAINSSNDIIILGTNGQTGISRNPQIGGKIPVDTVRIGVYIGKYAVQNY
jgi:subtilisin family serine protease